MGVSAGPGRARNRHYSVRNLGGQSRFSRRAGGCVPPTTGPSRRAKRALCGPALLQLDSYALEVINISTLSHVVG